MATIVTINAGDQITNSRADLNTNFANLNSDKIETSYLDTDTSLAANSDTKIATQKAVKTYIDTSGGSNASETVRGIVEEATDAEVTAGTATGGTGAKLFVTPAKLATRLTTFPAVGAGNTSRGGTTASGSQTIAHGLGRTPKLVSIKVRALTAAGGTNSEAGSDGSYNGTTQGSVWFNGVAAGHPAEAGENTTNIVSMVDATTNSQLAVASVDATNITLTWTKAGSGISGTMYIQWFALG